MTFRQKHWRHAIILGLLVLTGFGLFLSSWRRAIGPFFPVVQWAHVVGGIFYGVAIIGWSRTFYPWSPKDTERHLGPVYARWGYFILLMLLLSGGGLLVGPASTRALATVLHGLASLALIVWALWHLLLKIPLFKKPSGDWHLSRRGALRWMAGTAVAVPVVILGVPTLSKMLSGRLFAKGSNEGALPGFVPYTVISGFPNIPKSRWQLWVHGLDEDHTYHWAEYAALPRRTVVINFRCVTGWVVPHTEFAGVDLHDFLISLGWNPDEKPWVTFYSGDGVYTDTLNIQQILHYRPLLVDVIDHQPLPIAQGFPVRLLVPEMYGYKSVKWLIGIRVSKTAELGFWEQRGYPQNAFFGSYL